MPLFNGMIDQHERVKPEADASFSLNAKEISWTTEDSDKVYELGNGSTITSMMGNADPRSFSRGTRSNAASEAVFHTGKKQSPVVNMLEELYKVMDERVVITERDKRKYTRMISNVIEYVKIVEEENAYLQGDVRFEDLKEHMQETIDHNKKQHANKDMLHRATQRNGMDMEDYIKGCIDALEREMRYAESLYVDKDE